MQNVLPVISTKGNVMHQSKPVAWSHCSSSTTGLLMEGTLQRLSDASTISSGQSRWTVQWYLPGGASVHAHLTRASLGSPKIEIQNQFVKRRSVQAKTRIGGAKSKSKSKLKWHIDQFSHFGTAHSRVATLYNGWPISPLTIAPSHGGSAFNVLRFLGPPESSTQTAS